MKSNCCNEEVKLNVENPEAGDTVYYICTKCGKACDAK